MARRPSSSPASEADDDHAQQRATTPHETVAKLGPLLQVTNAASYSRLRKGKGKARQVVQDDEDEENEPPTGNISRADAEVDADGDEAEEGTPKGRKRVKTNSGQGRAVKSSLGGVASRDKGQIVPFQRDVDNYVPGSIVRIQLLNFVTYDYVEFNPGPYLNMILGPNGTGKSSIACAIAIGLGWPPHILGRATELSSFVKHGCQTGHVEIELKGAPGEANLIVRRELSALEKKKSNFLLNGQKVSQSEATERVKALNVQVENLCTFLPQDRVTEFAAMTPPQILKETQRAAGAVGLSDWHGNLIELGKERASILDGLDVEKANVQQLQERNNLLERDIKRYQERKKIEKEIQLLQIILPALEYNKHKCRYDDLKVERQRLAAQLVAAKATNTPLKEFKAQLDNEYSSVRNKRSKLQDESKEASKTLRKKQADAEAVDLEVDAQQKRLDLLKKNEKERKNKIAKLKEDIAKVQKQVDNPPKLDDPGALREQMMEKQREGNECGFQVKQLQEEQQEIISRQARAQENLRRGKQDIADLANVRIQRLQALRKWDADAADAADWLSKNQDKFKMEVFEPACVSLTVLDHRFMHAVESCFGQGQLKTFVCQCREDYDTLTNYVNDTPQALGRKGRIQVWFRPYAPENLVAPPMSREEAATLGFDGYAFDYVKGPEGMLWYLQREIALHRTLIALDARRVDGHHAMDMCSRPIGGRPAPPTQYILGDTICNVTRSAYGRMLPQSSTRPAQPAKWLNAKDVDTEVKSNIQKRIAEVEEEARLEGVQIEELGEKIGELRERYNELKKESDILSTKRLEIRKAQATIEKQKMVLRQMKMNLEVATNAKSPEEEKESIKKSLYDAAVKRADITLGCRDIAMKILKLYATHTAHGLRELQIKANLEKVKDLSQQQDDEVQRIQAICNQCQADFNRERQDSKDWLARAQGLMNQAAADVQEQFNDIHSTLIQRTIEDTNQQLEEARAKLELNHQTDPGVVDQYERRKDEIARLRANIEQREHNAGMTEERIQTIKDQWLPALQELVARIGEKFSAAFDSIGCAGEIKISEHEDYDKWAIDILVKFRDTEKLQLLTAQRQSGGERSLTTIMYLMSLTELAKAPFSLVDEINQGMDARAERLVHNALVKSTCEQDTGQYFLITPKLLTDLRYHPKMKILCVNNGEWLPEERGIGNLNRLIDMFVTAKGKGSAR